MKSSQRETNRNGVEATAVTKRNKNRLKMDAKETISDNNQSQSEATNQPTSTTDDAAPVKAFYLNLFRMILNEKLTNLIFY